MLLNGLPVPDALKTALLTGAAKLTPREHRVLVELVGAPAGDSFVALCGLDWIERENLPWSDPDIAKAYQGTATDLNGPGDFDVRRSMLIGFAGSDEPIALDFRTDPPRVIYLPQGGQLWRVLAPSYEALRSMLSVGEPRDR